MASQFSYHKTLPDLSNFDLLDGTNYRRWLKKLLIFFEAAELDHFLFHNAPMGTPTKAIISLVMLYKGVDKNDQSKQNSVGVLDEAMKKFKKGNHTVRGLLLKNMSNSLFDLFVQHKPPKEIWEILEKRYGADDTGMKKYVVGNWLTFQMDDDKTVMNQVHIYENLITDVLNEGMKMCEILQANVPM